MKRMNYFLMYIMACAACNNAEKIRVKDIDHIKEINTPCIEGGEPNLFLSDDGSLYLSWLEYDTDTTYSLRYSEFMGSHWTEAKVISTGSDWFVNWADFPSIAAFKGHHPSLASHWLQMSADGVYDYDIKISQSHDDGKSWGGVFSPHTDSIKAEHGFVSMVPLSDERMFATWLDGRNTKSDENTEDSHGHGGGPMTLRAATFDKSGNLYDEVELDNRVCDCCQTSAAVLDDGVIVAYRNRTEGEVRDIAVVRKKDRQWLAPKIVYEDNWVFPGCPVNGPVVKTFGKNVAVSWFAMNDTIPEVKVAFSNDSGDSFRHPIRIDHGRPLGRVDVVFLSSDSVLASWLERTEEGASVMAVRLNTDGAKGETTEVIKTKSSRRGGFPRMEKYKDAMIFAWTTVDSISRVKTLQMPIYQ